MRKNILDSEFQCLFDDTKLKSLAQDIRNNGEIIRFTCSEEGHWEGYIKLSDDRNPCFMRSRIAQEISRRLPEDMKSQFNTSEPSRQLEAIKNLLKDANEEGRRRLYESWPIKNERLLRLGHGILIPLKDDSNYNVPLLYKEVIAGGELEEDIIRMLFTLEHMADSTSSEEEYWDIVISLLTVLFDPTAVFVDHDHSAPVLEILFDQKHAGDGVEAQFFLDSENNELIRLVASEIKKHRPNGANPLGKKHPFLTYVNFETTKKKIMIHLATETGSLADGKQVEILKTKTKKFFPYLQKLLDDAYRQTKPAVEEGTPRFPVFLIGPGNSYAFDSEMIGKIASKLNQEEFGNLWLETFGTRGALSYTSDPDIRITQVIENCWEDIRLLSYQSTVKELERKMIEAVTNRTDPDSYSYLIQIPLLCHLDSENGKSSQPVVTLSCFFRGNPHRKEKLHLYEMAHELQFAFSHVLNAEVEHTERLRNSLRSFSASTMARTMAHNFSHVIRRHISTLTNSLEKILKKLANDVKEVTDKLDELVEKAAKEISHEEKKLYNYVLRRMVFIADITGKHTLWYASQRLTDALYPFDRNKGVERLRENIAKSEGYNEVFLNTDDMEKLKRDGIMVAIPWGGSGAHALYSILENHVRNLAKYSQPKNKSSQLILNIKVKEDDEYPRLYKVTLWDNASSQAQAEEVEQIIEKMQKTNQVLKKGLVDFLDDEGNPIREYLGFAEMLISASFLRGIDIEHLVDLIDFPPLLEVEPIDGRLGLVFYLLKPKEILVIDKAYADSLKEKEIKELQKIGVAVKDSQWLEQQTAEAGYRFVVINDVLSKAEQIVPELPLRVVSPGNCVPGVAEIKEKEYEEMKTNLKGRNVEKAIGLLYRCWLRHLDPTGEYDGGLQPKKSSYDGTVIQKIQLSQSKSIVFHHHGYTKKRIGLRFVQQEKPHHYEAYPTGSSMESILDESASSPSNQKLLKLVESALTDIVIIDERLFDEFKGLNEDLKFLEAKRIFVKGDKTRTDYKYDVDLSHGKFRIPGIPDKKYQFLLLHKGIIDKLKNELAMGKDNRDITKELLSRIYNSKNFEHVIIHSDRGPGKLHSGAKFLDYSTITDCIGAGEVLEKRHKFELVEVLSCLM